MKHSKKIFFALLTISLVTAYLPKKAYAEEPEDLTVYDKWNAKKIEVTFDPNMPDNAPAGSKVKGTMKKQTFTYGKSAKLNNAAYRIAGFTFAEWNTVKAPTAAEPGKSYGNKAAVDAGLFDAGETVTLYAQWKPKQYKITYKNAVDGKNGVTENNNPSYYTVEMGTIVDKDNNRSGEFILKAPVRTGYALSFSTGCSPCMTRQRRMAGRRNRSSVLAPTAS